MNNKINVQAFTDEELREAVEIAEQIFKEDTHFDYDVDVNPIHDKEE